VNSTNTTSPSDDPLTGQASPSAATAPAESKSLKRQAALTLGALGIVFGYIATSPI
jgi:hypothetical protein